jgi:hypothetical protein
MEDEDGDGRADCMVVSSNGLTLSISNDRNRDGQYDYRDHYLYGRVVRSEADNDFDGQFDEWATFYFGFPATVETDADGDGRGDIFSAYTNGVLSYSTIRMTTGKRDFFTEYYEHGIRSKVVIQKDGMERSLKCGKYGQIEFSEE